MYLPRTTSQSQNHPLVLSSSTPGHSVSCISADIVEPTDVPVGSGATGRNGGHLTPNPFLGFRARQSQYGTSEAVKSYAIERHTADSIVSFVQSHDLHEQVDLVHGGHYKLFPSSLQETNARADHEAAIEAGWNPAQDIEWFEATHMNKVRVAHRSLHRAFLIYDRRMVHRTLDTEPHLRIISGRSNLLHSCTLKHPNRLPSTSHCIPIRPCFRSDPPLARRVDGF